VLEEVTDIGGSALDSGSRGGVAKTMEPRRLGRIDGGPPIDRDRRLARSEPSLSIIAVAWNERRTGADHPAVVAKAASARSRART